MKVDSLERLDEVRLRLPNPHEIPVTVFARPEVPIESKAVAELSSLLELGDTLERLQGGAPDFFGGQIARLERVAVTPDFHKGAGIPIGTVMATRGLVVPQAVGNDINCGMRVHLTDIDLEGFLAHRDELESRLRHLFFEGGRDIPMTARQRQAMCRHGLVGLLESVPAQQQQGLWSLFHRANVERDLPRVHGRGSLAAGSLEGLENYLGSGPQLTRDDQIGSIGGGNHFVEFQQVHKILDGGTAHAWGLRQDQILLMVHSGSLMIGHLCGTHIRSSLTSVFPRTVAQPGNGIFVLPEHGPHQHHLQLFFNWLHIGANFAFANRLFLALQALRAVHECCGEGPTSLLYDAPHNLVWSENGVFVHRKGACPARGPQQMSDGPFAYFGEPVLVPGSMGASSFILAGGGNPESLWSASHGAGRQLSRGQALRGDDGPFREFLDNFRVVTPVDFRRPDIRLRPDIVQEKLADLKKEAPFAYKGIGPVIRTLEQAHMARPVVELRPLMTVKV